MSSYDQEEGTDALRGALRVIECLLNQLDKLTLSNAMLKRELQEKTKAAADIPSATQAQLESKNRMIVSATQENNRLREENAVLNGEARSCPCPAHHSSQARELKGPGTAWDLIQHNPPADIAKVPL